MSSKINQFLERFEFAVAVRCPLAAASLAGKLRSLARDATCAPPPSIAAAAGPAASLRRACREAQRLAALTRIAPFFPHRFQAAPRSTTSLCPGMSRSLSGQACISFRACS